MIVWFGLSQLPGEWRRSAVCIGVFDGVHRGHQELVRRTVEAGRRMEAPALLVTFDRHPAALLAPEKRPLALQSVSQNLRQLRRLGLSGAVVLAFDEALAAMPAEEFTQRVLVESLRCEQLVVGHDFALGKGRAGSAEWLAARIPTTVVEPVLTGAERTSSSLIRRHVQEGRMAEAEAMLGRPFSLEGIVVGGDKIGRTLGCPTLNLARAGQIVEPADGVYAATASLQGQEWGAAASIGTRPTVDGERRVVEAHLLDYSGPDLYGVPVELRLHERIRGQEKFSGLDELKAQMARDVEAVRAILSQRKAGER
jgi:riboflavin kinase/FMN adenylyltransferase